MASLSSLTIQSQWSMSPGSSPSVANDVEGLSQLNTIANVALDMFVDSDSTNAQSEVDASYEIMIWLGSFGDPKPLGFSQGASCWNQSLGNAILYAYRQWVLLTISPTDHFAVNCTLGRITGGTESFLGCRL